MEADFGGPVLWFLLAIMAGSALLAAYIILDSLRPARAERFESTMTRVIWVGPQVVYLVAVVASVLPAVPSRVRFLTLAAMPIAIILQVTYLLKIAYPKPEGVATAHALSDPDEGESTT